MSLHDDDPPPSPRLQPGIKIALGIIGACLLGSCCVFSCVLASLIPRDLASPGSAAKQSDDPAENDHYKPDCAIIRTYLKQRYGEIEVVSWGKRSIWNNEVPGDHAMLSCRFRRQVERRTRSGDFTIGPYNTVENAFLRD